MKLTTGLRSRGRQISGEIRGGDIDCFVRHRILLSLIWAQENRFRIEAS